jgi:hypothetical protein
MHNWSLLYTTTNISKAGIIRGMLQDNCIEVIMLNKMASSYLNFGEVELYVPVHFKEVAHGLLNQSLLN